MNSTWVLGWPTGHESGEYLTLDLGGTNLRTCWVELKSGKGETQITQDSYTLPEDLKTGEASRLWDFVAESLGDFIKKYDLKGTNEEQIPFGFTFSYPAIQESIDHGVLQTWTKGLDIKGVEGENVAEQLREALKKWVCYIVPTEQLHSFESADSIQDLPIQLVALINDTTGAMIASSYNDPQTIAGAIFGTGCNAAYMEDCGSIPKLLSQNLAHDLPMAINCEYGAFDNSHQILPRTKYDKQIDQESPRPGEQAFEKMSAGLYLGEIFRLVLLDVYDQGLVFSGQNVQTLREPYKLDTGFLSGIENDHSPGLSVTRQQYKDVLQINITDAELVFSQRLAEAIAVRGARLCTCGIAAICRKKGIKEGHVAADGSVANKHPKFKKRWADALGEVLGWPKERIEDPITITSAEDGSGVGAAVIAAMTLERVRKGDQVGISDRWK